MNAVEEKPEDPYVDCEQNLLKHILNIQNEIMQRLDLVEEQVSSMLKFFFLSVIVCRMSEWTTCEVRNSNLIGAN